MAIADFGLDPRQAIFIGDKDCDIELGQQFSAKTILVNNGQYEVRASPSARVTNLIEAATIIRRWSKIKIS